MLPNKNNMKQLFPFVELVHQEVLKFQPHFASARDLSLPLKLAETRKQVDMVSTDQLKPFLVLEPPSFLEALRSF